MFEATAASKPCRVMLIEDDPDDVFLFERALDRVRAGLRREIALEYAADGLDAAYRVSVDDLMTRLPDVVVLDLNMPRLDGVKFLHALRGSFELRDLPVVVLTTSTERPIHDEALRAGADRVFVKPDSAGAMTAIAADIVERGLSRAKSETLRTPHRIRLRDAIS